MKKIVALALCLIMALSLATVAFAADTYTLKTIGDELTVKAAAGNFVAKYVSKVNGKVYVVVPQTESDDEVSINSTPAEIYVAEADDDNNYGKYTVTAKKFKAPDAVDQKCGDVILTVKYVDAAGNYYVDYTAAPAKAVWLNVDGAVVKAEAYTPVLTDVKQHTVTPTYDDNGKVAGFSCSVCDAKLAYTKVKADALTSGKIFEDKLIGTTHYYVMYAATGTTTTTTGVSSAKTFDAGVALYAGMALMSVAGSAVVIGKKKEF